MFTLTLRLKTTHEQEELLYKLMRTYAYVNNVMVSHAQKCLAELRKDERYKELKISFKNNKRYTAAEKKELYAIFANYGLTNYGFSKYMKAKNNLNKYVNSGVLRNISNKVWNAVEYVLYKGGDNVNFIKRNNFRCFTSNDNKTGVYYRNGVVRVAKMKIRPYIRKNDTYAIEALKNEIVLCRIKRKWHKHSWRYYVDIVLKGDSPKKRSAANGTVKAVISPTSITATSGNGSLEEKLARDVESIDKEIIRVNRKIERQKRANNPENYKPNGKIRRNSKYFKREWKESHSQHLMVHKRRELSRLRKDKVNLSHHILALKIMELGNVVQVERKRSHSDTKMSKKNIYLNLNGSPSKFIAKLQQKLNNAGGELVHVSSDKTKI